MRIGLIRHFPVEERLPSGLRTAEELHEWRARYEASPATVGPIDVGALPWGCCISSDLPRAVITAKTAFPGPVECTSLLREPEFSQFQTGGLRLPVWAWRCLMGLAWMMGHESQRSCRDDFLGRVSAIADAIEARNADVLVVSHAGMMAYLSRELRRRGFEGPKFGIAEHAKLYVFERRSRGSFCRAISATDPT